MKSMIMRLASFGFEIEIEIKTQIQIIVLSMEHSKFVQYEDS